MIDLIKLVFGLCVLAFGLLLVGCWVHGLILAFSASILLGIICLFLEVPFVVFGLVHFFLGFDLAQHLVELAPNFFVF